MKKIIVSAGVILSLSLTSFAYAQSITCTQVVGPLTTGSSGAQVRSLQNFLVSQDYPGGGNWMITGYFGQATAAALRLFQQERGLPQTGMLDSATASAIANVSCGAGYSTGYAGGSSYSYPGFPGYTGSSYNYGNSYPYYNGNSSYWNGYGYGVQPTITSLSQNTGYAGNSVTVYGSGFDLTNNAIHFGSQTLYGIPSTTGTSLTFTVPSYYASASYSLIGTPIELSVGTSRGTSNDVSFTLYGGYTGGCGSYPYNAYPYNNSCGCNYYYGSYCQQSNPRYVSLSSLSPDNGAVGTTVTIYGTGFTSTGNTVRFGTGIISNLNSPDGRSVSFSVPTQLTGYGSQPVTIGTYNVSVTNNIGVSSNSLSFAVTSTGSTGTAPSITNVSGPTSLAVNQQGTWTITMNNPSGTYASVSVNWGDTGNGYVNMAAPEMVYGTGTQTLTFTHAYYQSGSFTITFTVSNSNGLTNSYTTTIGVGGTQGTPSISYVTPSSGRVGTQIEIVGSGFSSFNNTVRFGNGGSMNLPSYNGTTIYYTIPSTVSPCSITAPNIVCTTYAQLVTPGSYQLSVQDPNGTSNTVTFTVTY